jgi:hypothetical protein
MQAAQDGRLVCYCGVTVVAAHKHPPPLQVWGHPLRPASALFLVLSPNAVPCSSPGAPQTDPPAATLGPSKSLCLTQVLERARGGAAATHAPPPHTHTHSPMDFD